MTAASVLFIAGCAVVALLALVAVLAHSFDDTLLQRLALSGLSISAFALAWHALRGASEIDGAQALFAGSLALFAVETARKVAWRRYRGRWWHDR